MQDFHQLPPVFSQELSAADIAKREKAEKGELFLESKYAFEVSAWKRSKFIHFRLKKVFRQQDEQFSSMLSEMAVVR